MRIAFRATAGGFEADEYFLICGFAGVDADGAEHYLNFQRAPEGEPADEDWGVHLEFDDQINGGYRRVRECRLRREQLSVDLSQQLGALVGVQAFDVALAIDDPAFEQIRIAHQLAAHQQNWLQRLLLVGTIHVVVCSLVGFEATRRTAARTSDEMTGGGPCREEMGCGLRRPSQPRLDGPQHARQPAEDEWQTRASIRDEAFSCG